MVGPPSLDHVQIAAPRGCEARAREFYGSALGLAEIKKPEPLRTRGGIWFALGDAQLHIGVEEPFAPARKAHPALRWPDGELQTIAGRLADAGAPVRWDHALPGVNRFFTDDPWGNRLECISIDMSPAAGRFVTERFEYDGGRQVTAYVPPAAPEAIVFAGDGQLITSWGSTLEAADLPPTMIVGAHRLDDETLRLREYSPGESTAAFAFDPARFAAHEKFFVEDVRRWAQSRFAVALPADRTAVFGVSASGELALAMGMRHPEIYGVVFCASPGAGYRPPAVMPTALPRAYLVAGMQEPFFLANAARWADALRDAGADVVMTERVGSHGDAFWREELSLMVAWAFGR